MIYYTGDLHGAPGRVLSWMEDLKGTATGKVFLLQLGDAGLNYYLDSRDHEKKAMIQSKINELKERGILPQILFVRGNHECRPQRLPGYVQKKIHGGQAYVEEKYPDLLFLKDGAIYEVEGKSFLALGGGYSKDFLGRLLRGEGYWFDEQLEEDEFLKILKRISSLNRRVYILSHMLPVSVAPGRKEVFSRKNRTEYWLQTIREILADRIIKWIAGHYHYNLELPGGEFEIIFDRIKRLQ